jgi:hypothetical protein
MKKCFVKIFLPVFFLFAMSVPAYAQIQSSLNPSNATANQAAQQQAQAMNAANAPSQGAGPNQYIMSDSKMDPESWSSFL